MSETASTSNSASSIDTSSSNASSARGNSSLFPSNAQLSEVGDTLWITSDGDRSDGSDDCAGGDASEGDDACGDRDASVSGESPNGGAAADGSGSSKSCDSPTTSVDAEVLFIACATGAAAKVSSSSGRDVSTIELA